MIYVFTNLLWGITFQSFNVVLGAILQFLSLNRAFLRVSVASKFYKRSCKICIFGKVISVSRACSAFESISMMLVLENVAPFPGPKLHPQLKFVLLKDVLYGTKWATEMFVKCSSQCVAFWQKVLRSRTHVGAAFISLRRKKSALCRDEKEMLLKGNPPHSSFLCNF